MIKASTSAYEFGDFRLDPASKVLLRRDGELVPLTPRVFDTLHVLVEHRGTLLEKDRLMAVVWPDTVVEENNLAQHISTLRRVLGDTPGSHRFIETVPARGYRFVAEVKTATEPAAGEEEPETAPLEVAQASGLPAALKQTGSSQNVAPPARSWARSSAAAVALVVVALTAVMWWRSPKTRTGADHVAPPEKNIAVLPFANLSGDPENAWFAEGVKDEILTRLSKVAALKVISGASTQRFKSGTDDIHAIAQQLGVANVLEGSVQRSGDSVRVTVQLINAQSGTHLWAETYDRKIGDMFQVETDVAQRVATALEATLTGAETRALKARLTVNVAAHQAYLKGRYFWNKRIPEGYDKAAEYFREAMAIDPDYAPAYAGLSDAYQLACWNAALRSELYGKAREAARKAIELDPQLAEPHASLGLLAMNYDWDWATAESEFKQAIALDPNYATAHHWYAEYLIALGRADEALAEIKRARDLDPLSLIINTDTGKLLYYARRYDEAAEQLRETLRMDAGFIEARLWLGLVYATTGRYDEAIAEYDKIPSDQGTFWVGYIHGIAGQRAEAEKILHELEELDASGRPSREAILWVEIGLGQKDQAFADLEKAYQTRSDLLTS
ncbi:MAG: winged helix-turn-helix domain-containing protein, partial [Chthoniobacterales bacterium]|nr:winged helix-turn-helix domain-containing protein [Chthoniobacterales bacterium]